MNRRITLTALAVALAVSSSLAAAQA